MNLAVEAARARGARTIVAEYVPTAKNAVVADLFANLGFRALRRAAADAASRAGRSTSPRTSRIRPIIRNAAPGP